MKKNLVVVLFAGVVALCMPAAYASEEKARVDHFQAVESETLAQAVENLSTYNQKLATLLQKDEITPQEMHSIHKLTYTLEEALQKMQTEIASLAVTLEEVHLGSERVDVVRVKDNGKQYLEGSQPLTKAAD
ncbi:hypothetical protein GCU85_09765 [Cardiobacteriales bacterium ML27]|uniref:Uncharacterized protein n=2 Tax=Ostreibacterium oceani TaxID=2654998 RepID=A0A6N7EZL7_9GAMM|nr:hypothetical protein [Ostreibacterium oceani]